MLGVERFEFLEFLEVGAGAREAFVIVGIRGRVCWGQFLGGSEMATVESGGCGGGSSLGGWEMGVLHIVHQSRVLIFGFQCFMPCWLIERRVRRPDLLALISCSCAVGSLSLGLVGFAVDFHGVPVGLPTTSVASGGCGGGGSFGGLEMGVSHIVQSPVIFSCQCFTPSLMIE